MKIEVLAGGQLRDNSYIHLIETYTKRLSWDLKIFEINVSSSKKAPAAQVKQKERDEFNKYIDDKAYIIALDENGKHLTSEEFAGHLAKIRDELCIGKIQFIIGGAYGIDAEILQKSQFKLCFGNLTWPHMMVRLMLVEQIYRAQQIQIGHPYHKE